jgi:predicted phosphodiesterase
VTAPLLDTDINLYLTGGSSNTNPNLSLGGNVSTTKVNYTTLHNLFRQITDSELSSGVTIYRCIAIKNDNTTETMVNPIFFMVVDTTSVDDLSLYSFAQADKNTAETAVSDEFTAPTGSKINFIATLNSSGGLKLPSLAAGEYVNVWLRISVNPGAKPFPENAFKMRVTTDNSGTSGPPTPPPDPDTGVNFSIVTTADCSCGSNFDANWTKMKAKNPALVVINGDDAYSSGSQCFTDKIGTTWKSKTITSFGNHDVDESESQPSTKNQLLNFFSLPLTYYNKTINNVGIIVMESGENQSVSDSVGSSQYNFVKSQLESYKADASIEWIFVFNHYPFYGPSSNHGNNTGGRDRYDVLFDANGVDAVFTGHNHNMWHSKLLAYNSGSPSNPTATGTDPNYSYNRATANHGKLYFGVGGGGKSHYSISSVPSYVVYSNDSNYGYWLIEFSSSGKVATFKNYKSDDTLLKTVTLTHT